MSRPRAHPEGFTLLELLAALVVTSLVVLSLTEAMHFGIQSWGRQSRQIEAYAELDSVDGLLRHLLDDIDPSAGDEVEGRPSEFVLTSSLPESVAASQRRARITLLVTDDHRLVLSWIDPTAAIPPGGHARRYQATVLENVAGIEFGYFLAGPQSGWKDTWSEATLPALVRLRVLFPPGDPRHWPAIVAASRITPGGG